jgi:hypothetical protein
MGRLVRGVIRALAVFIIGTLIFAAGAAVFAANARRRIVTTDDRASNGPTLAAIFGSGRFASRAPALRGGRVVTWFAGHDVDLRGAALDPGGAILELSEIDEVDRDDGAPLLEVRGFVLFGGVRVTSSPVVSWSGADHEGEALPPAAGAVPFAADTPAGETRPA